MSETVKIQMEAEVDGLLNDLDRVKLKVGEVERAQRSAARQSRQGAKGFSDELGAQAGVLGKMASSIVPALGAAFTAAFSLQTIKGWGEELDRVIEKMRVMKEGRQLTEAQILSGTGDLADYGALSAGFAGMKTGLDPAQVFGQFRGRLPVAAQGDIMALTRDAAVNAWRATGGLDAAGLAPIVDTAAEAYKAGVASDRATDVAFRIQQDAGAAGKDVARGTQRIAGLYLGRDGLSDEQRRGGFYDVAALSVVAGRRNIEAGKMETMFKDVERRMAGGVDAEGRPLEGTLGRFGDDVVGATMYSLFEASPEEQAKIFGSETLTVARSLAAARGEFGSQRAALVGTDSEYMNRVTGGMPAGVKSQLDRASAIRAGDLANQNQAIIDDETRTETMRARLDAARADRSFLSQAILAAGTSLGQRFLPKAEEEAFLGGQLRGETRRKEIEEDRRYSGAAGLPVTDPRAVEAMGRAAQARRDGFGRVGGDRDGVGARARQKMDLRIRILGPDGMDVIADAAAGNL
jgi:hypothetical protein